MKIVINLFFKQYYIFMTQISSMSMTILDEYFKIKSIKKVDIAHKTDTGSSRISHLSRNLTTNLKVDELYLIALDIYVEPNEILLKVCKHLKLKKVK